MREKILHFLMSRGKKSYKIRTEQYIVLSFFAVILLGTLLLMLPISSRSGESCGFLTAWFTATSATCVTRLLLVVT